MPAELDTRPHSPDHTFPMGDRTDWRPIDRPTEEGSTLAWERLRAGVMHRAALVVFGDILGAAVEATTTSFVLSLEISIRFIRTPATAWVLQEAEVWHASDGYATGPARLWDDDGNLCAMQKGLNISEILPGTELFSVPGAKADRKGLWLVTLTTVDRSQTLKLIKR